MDPCPSNGKGDPVLQTPESFPATFNNGTTPLQKDEWLSAAADYFSRTNPAAIITAIKRGFHFELEYGPGGEGGAARTTLSLIDAGDATARQNVNQDNLQAVYLKNGVKKVVGTPVSFVADQQFSNFWGDSCNYGILQRWASAGVEYLIPKDIFTEANSPFVFTRYFLDLDTQVKSGVGKYKIHVQDPEPTKKLIQNFKAKKSFETKSGMI